MNRTIAAEKVVKIVPLQLVLEVQLLSAWLTPLKLLGRGILQRLKGLLIKQFLLGKANSLLAYLPHLFQVHWPWSLVDVWIDLPVWKLSSSKKGSKKAMSHARENERKRNISLHMNKCVLALMSLEGWLACDGGWQKSPKLDDAHTEIERAEEPKKSFWAEAATYALSRSKTEQRYSWWALKHNSICQVSFPWSEMGLNDKA